MYPYKDGLSISEIKSYAHVNGAPIKIIDSKTDQWKEYGEHAELGWNYYIVITTTYKKRTTPVVKGYYKMRECQNPNPMLPSQFVKEFIPTEVCSDDIFMIRLIDEVISFQREFPVGLNKAASCIRQGDSWRVVIDEEPFAMVRRIE